MRDSDETGSSTVRAASAVDGLPPGRGVPPVHLLAGRQLCAPGPPDEARRIFDDSSRSATTSGCSRRSTTRKPRLLWETSPRRSRTSPSINTAHNLGHGGWAGGTPTGFVVGVRFGLAINLNIKIRVIIKPSGIAIINKITATHDSPSIVSTPPTTVRPELGSPS